MFQQSLKKKLKKFLNPSTVIKEYVEDNAGSTEKFLRRINPYEGTVNKIGNTIPKTTLDEIEEVLRTLNDKIQEENEGEEGNEEDSQEERKRLARLLQTARDQVAALRTIKHNFIKLDLYLRALQLHLLDNEYYQSRGIKLFSSEEEANEETEYKIEYIEPGQFEEILNNVTEFTKVTVTAPAPNPYGHMILGLGEAGYIHMNDKYDCPQYIPKEKFNAYLKKHNRIVIGMHHIHVPDKEAALEKLRTVSQQPVAFLLWWNNCVNFADDILIAGGASCAELNPTLIGDYHHNTQYPFKSVAYVNPLALNFKMYEQIKAIEALYFYNKGHEKTANDILNDIKQNNDKNAVVLIEENQLKAAYFVINGEFLTNEGKRVRVELGREKQISLSTFTNNGKVDSSDDQHKTILTLAAAKVCDRYHHAPAKKYFREMGEKTGLTGEKAKIYSSYRTKHGLTHKEAQYKADPSFINFLVSHQSTMLFISALNPVLTIVMFPFIVFAHIKSLRNHYAFFKMQGQSTGKNLDEERTPLLSNPSPVSVSTST